MDSDQGLEWTLATPIINRELAVSLYLQSLRKINLPRENFHLLFVDLSKNPKIESMLQRFIEENPGWKSTSIEKPNLESFTEYKRDGEADYLERRVAIANTMNFINSKRKGNLLIWEEDIYAPEDAFIKCEKLFSCCQVAAVTACQYSRRLGWPDKLMAWDWKEESVFGSNDGCTETVWKLEPIRKEYNRGFATIDASATGFILISSDFLDGYTFDGYTDGQDVMLGKHIKDKGEYLLINWDVKTVHIGEDEEGSLRLFRSWQCKTKVEGIE